MIEVSDKYLYEKKVIYIKLFIIFEKLQNYLNDEFQEDFKTTKSIFWQYSFLLKYIEEWKIEIQKRKKDLKIFILNQIKDHQLIIKRFFENFDIKKTLDEVQVFINKLENLKYLFEKVDKHIIIFTVGKKEFQKEIKRHDHFLNQIINILKWICIYFEQYVLKNLIYLKKKYGNDFLIQNKVFMKFFLSLLKDLATYLKLFDL